MKPRAVAETIRSNDLRAIGISGDSASVFLAGENFRVPLAGDWKYRIEAEWQGGRRPDFVPGLPFEQQFLLYRNPVGPPPDASGPRRAVSDRADVTVALAAGPGENRYTQEVITVRAGPRVALAFDNTDDMLHNVVILPRGTDVQRAGETLNRFAGQPGASEADFVPPDLPLLAAGSMVEPRRSETLTFTAPAEPGDYPFICTFPGHWLTMRGVLRVVR